MAAIGFAINEFGVFGDEVYTSTDLNRRSGEVLNHALRGPVTISRNGEQFALLKREQAASLVRSFSRLRGVIEIFSAVLELERAGSVPSPLSWLTAFDADDRAAMCRELLAAVRNAHDDADWENVDAVIHAWRESGLVTTSGILEDAMNLPSEEIPLPDPTNILQEQEPRLAVRG